MRKIVQEVVDFYNDSVAGPSLRPAEQAIGKLKLRIFCIELVDWWGRGTLLVSRHPYMRGNPDGFLAFVQVTPELAELVQFKDQTWWFADSICRDEWQSINDYVRANYKPPLLAK